MSSKEYNKKTQKSIHDDLYLPAFLSATDTLVKEEFEDDAS